MEITKLLGVYFLASFKFIFGITGGYAAGYNMFSTMLITVIGMMTTVVIFTYFGQWLKRRFLDRLFRKRQTFTPQNRKKVRIWKKYGLVGIAFLTPILLMPIGGTLLATSFGGEKKKIILYMLISAIFWGFIQTYAFYEFGDRVRVYFE
ncbi:MAG: small multi-drug export protein [Cyclobacteriaceae bacterium]|nr:small multi-drug export protein [Cyclobacteriaceae bacterium]